MASVELRNVRKSFSGQEVLKGIDLSIRTGEFVVLVGPSGCGKSTLLRIVAGLEQLSAGEVLIDGNPAQQLAPAKRNLAMVFQNYSLYPHMTVAENMSFSLRLAGMPKALREAKVLAAARLLGVETLLNRKPRELSGGQSQRVAIGRAIVRQPRAFLFDEPLSNLDAELRAQMRVELVRLHRELKATMIYVTHDQVEAMTMADRIVVLNNGAMEQAGSPLELYQRPESVFVAGFLGSPRMNFLASDVMEAALGQHLIRGLNPETATVGIRPEDIALQPDGQLEGIIELVERLGSRTVVHIGLPGGETIAALAAGDTLLSEGHNVRAYFPPDRCHYFDRDGRRVPTASTAPAVL